jgi:hypothetical protein
MTITSDPIAQPHHTGHRNSAQTHNIEHTPQETQQPQHASPHHLAPEQPKKRQNGRRKERETNPKTYQLLSPPNTLNNNTIPPLTLLPQKIIQSICAPIGTCPHGARLPKASDEVERGYWSVEDDENAGWVLRCGGVGGGE